MLDKNITWKDHIHIIEKKLAKNTGLLYCATQLLDEESLKTIYFSYVHSYLNYDNIAWVSTYYTKPNKMHYQQSMQRNIFSAIRDLCYNCSMQ